MRLTAQGKRKSFYFPPLRFGKRRSAWGESGLWWFVFTEGSSGFGCGKVVFVTRKFRLEKSVTVCDGFLLEWKFVTRKWVFGNCDEIVFCFLEVEYKGKFIHLSNPLAAILKL